MPGNSRGFARRFTLEEIQLAHKLHYEDELPWDVVAYRVGPDVQVWSVKTVVSLYRRGKWNPTRTCGRALREKLEVAVTQYGVTDVEALCQHFKLTAYSMQYHLRQMGLDLEARREVRKDFDLGALKAMDDAARAPIRRVA
jgi:hypothetical protein